MKQTLLICLCIANVTLLAQDINKEIETMKAEFDTFRSETIAEYEDFREQAWKEFELLKGERTFQKPKPRKIPEATENDKPISPENLFRNKIKPEKPTSQLPEENFRTQHSSNFKENLVILSKQKTNKKIINFFGAKFILYYNDINFELGTPLTNENIIEAFDRFIVIKKELDDLIYQWKNHANLMELNDYGLLQLVRLTGQQLYKDENKAIFLTWLVLNKLNIDIRIGILNNELLLIAASSTPLAFTPYFKINDKKYYVLSFSNAQAKRILHSKTPIQSYESSFLEGEQTFNFTFHKAPNISKQKEKNSFFIKDKELKLELQYNFSYVDLLAQMPILDYPAYFHIPLHPETKKELHHKLGNLLKEKSDTEKVNILLNFVQYSFPYKLDSNNFGRTERPQAPEEMFKYKYSDCEDHSALFAWLVLTFTDLEVMGLLYSNHACTAVKFKDTIQGGYHLPPPYQDYFICDATYKGAKIGTCMPQYINIKPERIFETKRNY